MGQYHLIVNVSKRQFLYPNRMGDGSKLLEFGASGYGTMLGLAILLADSNGGNGGDLNASYSPDNPDCDPEDPHRLTGSWAGDRVVIVGDYGDKGKLYGTASEKDPPRDKEGRKLNLYRHALNSFCDISSIVRVLMCQDSVVNDQVGESWDKGKPFDANHLYAPRIYPENLIKCQ